MSEQTEQRRVVVCIEDEPPMIDLVKLILKNRGFVTAKAQNIDKVLGLHIAKVQDYITKPFSPAELLKSIDRVLQGKDDNGVEKGTSSDED